MSSRTRLLVATISTPIIAFAIVGGFLGKVLAREETYQHLKIFDDVVSLITNNYVEPVNVDKVMTGAMTGLADVLDPDSAYLTPDDVKQIESGAAAPAGDVGLELTRQYYLRVIAARDGSPAVKAGLRTGDYVRAIGDMPTREMSVWQGQRALRGAVGSKVTLSIIRGNAADPHIVELTRVAFPPSEVTNKIAAPGVGYLRIAGIGPRTADQVKAQVGELTKAGATKLVIDVRRTSTGALDDGLAIARLFVGKGNLAMRQARTGEKEAIPARSGDGTLNTEAVVLIDAGTSGAAEVFASALNGNQRADLVGERTIGRTAVQKLIKLPNGSGLWLSTLRYLSPSGNAAPEKGLEPTIVVDQPEVEFGQPAPAGDPALDRALEHLALKKAA